MIDTAPHGPATAIEPTLTVLDPTADRHGGIARSIAPRPTSLSQKVIGLLWNGKALGDVALQTVGAGLQERYEGLTVKLYSGAMPCEPKLLQQVADECDAVVACTADCGSCTSWITHDCVWLEANGIPSVIVASRGFEEDVEASARAFAMSGVQYVVVPKVYNNLNAELAQAQTAPVIAEISRLLTSGVTLAPGHPAPTQVVGVFNYQGKDRYDSYLAFNRAYMDRDWGDGFPLAPPTRRVVDELVAAVDGSAADLVCLLPPGNGEATVEKVAINAAMAGCRPVEMSVIMAALRAIAKMEPSESRGALMSTSAHAPLVLVNGPEASSLGINGGRACIGPGKQNEVNLRIGRALVFCLKNLGSWYPGIMDMDTLGTPRKHIVVIAENEAESPWEAYHVSQGFRPEQSTATVFFTSGEWDLSIQGHTDPQQLARAIASFSGGNNSGGYFHAMGGANRKSGLGRLLLMPPPHAIPLAEGGFTKRGLERFLYEHGQEPIQRLIEPLRKMHQDGKIKIEWQWLFDLPESEAKARTLPVIEKPELYSVVVAGSIRAKDLLMPTRVLPFTELISSSPS